MKIEPKYMDGEPVCSGEECDQYHDDFPNWWVCLVSNETITEGLPCLPSLRRDRDKAIKERDDLRCCGNCVEFEHEDCREDENCRVWQAMQDPWLTCIDWQPRPDLFEGGE